MRSLWGCGARAAEQFREHRIDVHALAGRARRVSELAQRANDKYVFGQRIRDHGSIDATGGRKID